MSGYFDSIAFAESLLAAMASKTLEANQPKIKNEFSDGIDTSFPPVLDTTIQHGIWNTIVPDGLQLLIAQREKHNQEQRKKQEEKEQVAQTPSSQPDGFVYVDVSGSSSPASTQGSTSSLSQPPPSNLSSTSISSFSSFDSSTEKALKDALNITMSRAPRTYRWASTEEKESLKYKAKRERNNEAVRRSREKNKFKKLMEDEKYEELRKRYELLLDTMKHCTCGCASQIAKDHGAQL